MAALRWIYFLTSFAVCGWFSTAAYKGWQSKPLFAEDRSSPGRSSGGFYYHPSSGGFRSSGGAWGGGK